jgi:xylulokinase
MLGPIAPYWSERYGLSPDTRIAAWSGDNPNSMIGLGLIQEGMAAISLGTSDTFFGMMSACQIDPRGEGHVFVAPTGDYMSLICFANGSLARDKIREQFGLSWAGFSEAVQATPPGNHGRLMLPWFSAEIVPRVTEPGVHRLNLSDNDAAGNCRAVIEAQMLSMKLHSEWMRVSPSRIYATGGAAENDTILQVMADVHQCPVYRQSSPNSAALGAALRAAHAFLFERGQDPGWKILVQDLTAPDYSSVFKPDKQTRSVYENAAIRYQTFEEEFRPS